MENNLTLIQNIYTFWWKYLTVIQIFTKNWPLAFDFTHTLKHLPLAYSLINEVHWHSLAAMHCDIETIWRNRIHGKVLIKKMRTHCDWCTYLKKKKTTGANMVPVSKHNITIATLFYATQFDICGPFKRSSVLQRRIIAVEWSIQHHQWSPSSNGKHNDFENMDLITPNRLKLGCNNERHPVGSMKVIGNPQKINAQNKKIFETWFSIMVNIPCSKTDITTKLIPKWWKYKNLWCGHIHQKLRFILQHTSTWNAPQSHTKERQMHEKSHQIQ